MTLIGNGRTYPRDIGRSSSLGKGGVIFQFGDTIAHNDAGEFIGGTSSTAAVVQDPTSYPTVTSYSLDDEGKVPSFIPLRPEERDQDLYGKRTTLLCFGGIVEIGEADGDVATGWVFYQKGTQVSDIYRVLLRYRYCHYLFLANRNKFYNTPGMDKLHD
jgi:hypothetical protein